MLVRRSLSLITALGTIVALGGHAPVAAAAAPPTDYTQVQGLSEAVYETTLETFRVPMEDGTEIYVEVVRPVAEGRFPVILEASPYHGTLHIRTGTRVFPDPRGPTGQQLGLTGYFAPRGYAVAMMDLRGTGRSQGCLDHLAGNDAADLKTTIEWLADQPWSNGRVGMAGHSYVAASQVVAAAQRPEGLVTIVPSAGLASMYDHQFHMGVPYFLQWAGPQWAYELLAMDRHLPPGARDPVSGGSTGDNFGNDMQDFGCGWQHSALLAGSGQVTGQYENWHAERDWEEAAAEADIPIFMVHGVRDNAARIPAAEWFFKDRPEVRTERVTGPPDHAKGPPDHAKGQPNKVQTRPVNAEDKVWLGQWDHGGSSGSCAGNRGPHPNCRFAQWQFALHAWFDKHLQQRDVDTGPPVEVFLNDGWVYTDERWAPEAEELRLHANAGAASLEAAPPEETDSVSFVGAPAWSTTGPTFVDFVSDPVTERTVIAGVPDLRLSAATSGPVQLVASVYKRRGGSINFGSPVTICAIQPLLREGIDTVTPIVPAQRMDMEPQCFTSAHVLEPGDELVLRVSAAHRSSGSHHAPTLAADPRVTVFTDAAGTAVSLPRVVDAELHTDPL